MGAPPERAELGPFSPRATEEFPHVLSSHELSTVQTISNLLIRFGTAALCGQAVLENTGYGIRLGSLFMGTCALLSGPISYQTFDPLQQVGADIVPAPTPTAARGQALGGATYC